MSRHLVPPRAPEQLSRTKNRVHDLERRLARAIPEQGGYVAKWSLHGILYVSESGIELHPSGGRLILLYAVLVTAGSTATELELLKNGAVVGNLNLPATRRYNEEVVSVECAARTDELQIGITQAGTDADTLTVFGLFDR